MKKKRRYRSRARLFLFGFLAVLFCSFQQGCFSSRPKPPRGTRPRETTVLTTGYCKCGKCCGWHRNWLGRPVFSSGPLKGQRKQVGITADGSKSRPGTIAADTSVFPFGTIIYVPGYGYGKVQDRGGAIKGKHLDLYFKSHGDAQEWGRRRKTIRYWPAKQR